jgi:hypothetical protein
MTDKLPNEPLTQMVEGTAQIHELFLSFVAGGFSEMQALYLVGQILAAQVRPS